MGLLRRVQNIRNKAFIKRIKRIYFIFLPGLVIHDLVPSLPTIILLLRIEVYKS